MLTDPQKQDEDKQINRIAEAKPVLVSDDAKAEQEKHQFDLTALQANIEDVVTKHLANVATQDTINARRFFTGWLFWTTYAWLILVLLIVLADGCKLHGFSLPEGVLIALITTTTINVIAIFKCVTEYLFPVLRKKDETETTSSTAGKKERDS